MTRNESKRRSQKAILDDMTIQLEYMSLGKVYDLDGYDVDGYDADGYDANGYDANGYDANGYDADGYDADGYDRDGYEAVEGYDGDGCDADSFGKGDGPCDSNSCRDEPASETSLSQPEETSWGSHESEAPMLDSFQLYKSRGRLKHPEPPRNVQEIEERKHQVEKPKH